MISGLDIEDSRVGDGTEAISGMVAVVHFRAFLNRGEECMNTYADGNPNRIHLGKRCGIAGLEKGIKGMRVGGLRKLTISPHLAYGANRVGKIPPNAVLLFEVELLEVVEPGTPAPNHLPDGKQLVVFRPGEAARNLPRIQFGVHEDGRAGGFVSYPVPGGTWRHSRPKPFEFQLSATEAQQLINEVLKLSEASPEGMFPHDNLGFLLFDRLLTWLGMSPKGLLRHDDLWADASEKANSITRSRRTNELCVTINVYEGGKPVCYFALPESSPLLLNADFYKVLMTKFSEWQSHSSIGETHTR